MSNYTITVYTDATLTNSGLIHTWAVIRNNLGESTLFSFQCNNFSEVFGPTQSSFDKNNAIANLEARATASYTYDLSLDDYNKAVSITNSMRDAAFNNPNAYPYSLIPDGVGNNCVTALNGLLNEIGIFDFNEVIDPWLFGKVIGVLQAGDILGMTKEIIESEIDALVDVSHQYSDLFFRYTNMIGNSRLVYEYATKAFEFLNLRDPLAIDLDGNGISTISANEGITFDHNNSGIKYGTGWINPVDGWLALDRNGNGAIDSGRELFGDSTRKLDGNFAAHAYDALASFDTNKDGKVDVADATGDTDSDGVMEAGETYWDINNNGVYNADKDKTFADLRVWVDANSDGISSSGELKTLAELNITSIATGKTAGSGVDANGNDNTFKGDFTTADNVVHTNGTRSFNLVENKFFSENRDNINIPPDVAALPNMQGSGAVRDLHQAMSLGTAESLALKATVQAFNSATTRAAQYGMIDNLLMLAA